MNSMMMSTVPQDGTPFLFLYQGKWQEAYYQKNTEGLRLIRFVDSGELLEYTDLNYWKPIPRPRYGVF